MAKIYFDNHSLDLARAKIFSSLANEEQVKLFDVIELSSGDYLPKSKMEDGKYKVYGGGGLTQSTHTTSNVDFETIGIGRVGARCGCVFKIEKKSWVTDNALFVSNFKKKYDLSFLIHYLNHINLNQFANQSAQPVISQRGIAKCTVPDIDFYKQQQIGEILDGIEHGEDFEDIFNLKPVLKFEKNLSLLNRELDQQQNYLQLLRQTILQEAVQGKLTKQNPTDQSATELLKRIKAEKEKLINAGKLKKEKELPPITEDEIPFDLPEGWLWCQLNDIKDVNYSISYGVLVPGPDLDEGVPFVRIQDLNNPEEDKKPNKSIAPEIESSFKKTRLNGGEILIGVVGATIGKIAVAPKSWKGANIARAICRIVADKHISAEYLLFVLKNPVSQEYFREATRTLAQPTLNVRDLERTLIPLPPLAEQQRIVAKVQQLQQQLSQLEAQVQQSRQYAQQLLQSVLKEAFEQKGKVYDMEEQVSMVAEGEV